MSQLSELVAPRGKAIKEIARFFEYSHLPEGLQTTSKLFHDLACELLETITWDSHQLEVSLEKLLEAKDAAVRAKLID